MSLICCPIPILAFFACIFSPDSPVFLTSQGQEHKALKSIKRLYGPKYDSVTDLDLIKIGLKNRSSISTKKSQILQNLKTPEVYKPFLIIVLLGIVQQFSGMTILRAYVVRIFNGIFQTNDNV